MTLKPYTVGISAINKGGYVSSSCGMVGAVSDDEAKGKAMRICEGAFPASDGYYNHKASVHYCRDTLAELGYRQVTEPTWTRDKPTKPGWYWRAEDCSPGSVNCIEVCGRKGFPGLYIDSEAVGHTHCLDDVTDDSWWYGPVEAPQPPAIQEKASA